MGLYNSRPCKFGPACHRLAKTACKFYHPKSHVMRSQDMTAGLEDGVVLNAFGPVDTTFESYGIRKAEKIAGFNFLDDGRIAVPGTFLISLFVFATAVNWCQQCCISAPWSSR